MYKLFCIITLVLLSGCKTEDIHSNIPAIDIYYELPLNSIKARPLLIPLGIIEINKLSKLGDILPPEGIAIIKSLEKNDGYYAYDLQCPHEYPSKQKLIINGISLMCSKCKSQFQIIYGGGIPIHGPAKRPLRQYKTVVLGNILIIKN